MNKRLLFTLIAILVVALIIFKGVSVSQDNKGEIKIGLAFAMTGDAAQWGEASLNAAQLAIEEINKNGGINGKKLSFVLEDTKSTSKDTVSAVSKLQNVDNVNAIAATWLDSYQGAGSVINKNMLLISPDAAIESVNTPTLYPRVFSTWYRTESKSSVTIADMKSHGYKNIYFVLQNDPYYSVLRTFLEKEANKEGLNIVGDEMVNSSNGDMRTILSKVNASNADVFFFGSYDSKLNAEFHKQVKLLVNPKIALYGDEFIEQDFTSNSYATSTFEGIRYYVPAKPISSFTDMYKEKFGKDPVFSAGTTYDTIMIIAKYLSDSPKDIDSYMRSSTFPTITYGDITFDNLGGVVSKVPALVERQILDGKISDEK